jgi:mannitol-1-/sugar-/sorbitol-6-phosphatase
MTQIVCKGLLIDMDGVLVDSTPAVARVWARWAARHNMDPHRIVKAAHGRTSITTIRELLPDATPETHRAEDHWMEASEIEDVADVVALPCAQSLLASISPSQFAVVTSATRPLAEVRLRAAGVWQYVKNLVSAGDIQRGKPDPEPYLKGATLLGFAARDCVVVEDAPSGTRSGKAAGARVIAVRTTTDDAELLAVGADWIVNDCSSIRILSNSSPISLHLELLDDSATPRSPAMS